jgi:hypothetical protein
METAMKLKGILAGIAGVFFAAGLAGAANLSLLSGPQDPSQLLATINQLVQNINFGVNGRLSANVTAVGTTTTVEQTLMTYSLPANRLATDGDAVRVVCWGQTFANNNSKTIKLYFGNSVVSTASLASDLSPNGKKWQLEMIAMRSGAATQMVTGRATVDLTVPVVYTNEGTDALTSAVTVKCTGTTLQSIRDVTAQGMLVEQVK